MSYVRQINIAGIFRLPMISQPIFKTFNAELKHHVWKLVCMCLSVCCHKVKLILRFIWSLEYNIVFQIQAIAWSPCICAPCITWSFFVILYMQFGWNQVAYFNFMQICTSCSAQYVIECEWIYIKKTLMHTYTFTHLHVTFSIRRKLQLHCAENIIRR